MYTPLGFGPVKYKKLDNHGITFHDPQTDEKVGMYYHVNNPQHHCTDGQIVQPGTMVGTQGGLPGTSSAYPGSSAVHLHVEGTRDSITLSSLPMLVVTCSTLLELHTATQQQPQPAGARPQLGAANNPVSTAGATPQHQGPTIAAIPALAAATPTQDDSPIDSSSPFSIYNNTPGWGSMYGALSY